MCLNRKEVGSNAVHTVVEIFAEGILQVLDHRRGYTQDAHSSNDILDGLDRPELGKQRYAVRTVPHRTGGAKQRRKAN